MPEGNTLKTVCMKKITSILAKKQPHFHTILPTASAGNALHQMCCENVDYLVVMDEDKRYIGLITEHDIASGAVMLNNELEKVKVADIVNNRLPAATTDDTVERCMQMMQQHHVRYLPVFENFLFKGIISSEDILEEAVSTRMEIFDSDAGERDRFGMLVT